MYENRILKEDRKDVRALLKETIVLIIRYLKDDYSITVPEEANNGFELSNNNEVVLDDEIVLNNNNEVVLDDEIVLAGDIIIEKLELLLLAKENPSATVDNLKKTYDRENSFERPYYNPTYTSAKDLFVLFAALFGFSSRVEITGLRAWYPFTTDASFDNYIYSMFTSKAALNALTVHGILYDNRFENPCFLGTQQLLPSRSKHIKSQGSTFIVENNKISAICEFNYSYQSMFACDDKYYLYDGETGISDFTSEKEFVSDTLDSRRLREVLDSPETRAALEKEATNAYNFSKVFEPTLLRKEGLVFKNAKAMSVFDYMRNEETKYHELEKVTNLYNIRNSNKLFFSLLMNINERAHRLYFAKATIKTGPLMEYDYLETDPMAGLWNEFNRIEKASYIAHHDLLEIKTNNGNTTLYFKDGSIVDYNGEFAYEIDDAGTRVNNARLLLYLHEFELGKSYTMEFAKTQQFVDLENKITFLTNDPSQSYNNIRVELNDVDIFDGVAFVNLGSFMKRNGQMKILAINQYCSQDIIYSVDY